MIDERSAKEDMKHLIPIIGLLMLASCTPKTVEPVQSGRFPANLLSSLQQDLDKATIIVDGIKRDIDIQWMSKSHALMCQRQLDIYLGDNQIGAFINPSDQVTIDAFTEQLKKYLAQLRVIEDHIWNKKPEIIDKY